MKRGRPWLLVFFNYNVEQFPIALECNGLQVCYDIHDVLDLYSLLLDFGSKQ